LSTDSDENAPVCKLFFKLIIRLVSSILRPVFVMHRLHNVQVVLAFYAVLLPLQPGWITNRCQIKMRKWLQSILYQVIFWHMVLYYFKLLLIIARYNSIQNHTRPGHFSPHHFSTKHITKIKGQGLVVKFKFVDLEKRLIMSQIYGEQYRGR